MRALSIIGIVMSLIGVITSIYIMSESNCYCSDSYYYDDTPAAAAGGGMISLFVFIFMLVFSVIATVYSFAKYKESQNKTVGQPIAPFQTQGNPFAAPQQPFNSFPPYGQQQQFPPYGQPQNPYPAQPNQFNTNNPFQQAPPPPAANPFQQNNPNQNPFNPVPPPPNVNPFQQTNNPPPPPPPVDPNAKPENGNPWAPK
jgi:hypothetical protein